MKSRQKHPVFTTSWAVVELFVVVAVLAVLAVVASGCAGEAETNRGGASTTTGTSRPAPKIATPVGEDPLPRPLEEQLQKTLNDTLPKLTDTPGVIAAVWVPGTGAWASVAGVADPATKAPLATNQHIRIGTTTTSFTVMLILQLVDQGKLALDDPVSNWFQDDSHRRDTTVRDLAKEQGPEDAALLGKIAQKVSGRSFDQLLRDQILAPLGLNETSVPATNDTTLPKPFARGVTRSPGGPVVDATNRDPGALAYTANIISTVQDLEVWAYQLGSGKLLKPATAEAQRGFASLYDTDVLYGLGLLNFASPSRPSSWIGYEGEIDGYATLVAYDTTTAAVIVVVATSSVSVTGLVPAVAELENRSLPTRPLFLALRDQLVAAPPALPPSGTGVPATTPR